MKCTLIISHGNERSQRSCEMTEKLTTRAHVIDFLKAQDLRLEGGNFDYTVSLDGMEDTRPLRTDADVRLFLAQARQFGNKANFHISLHHGGAAPADMGSFLSAEYAVDLDLVTLHIYRPINTTTTAPEAAESGASASTSTHNRPYQEKMFVVPTRFVLDGLFRAVKDTLSRDTVTKQTTILLYALSSAEDADGAVLRDDAAALSFLHAQAKKREPARLTYTLQSTTSPTARRVSQPPCDTSTPSSPSKQPHLPQSPEQSHNTPASSPLPASAPTAAAVDPATPMSRRAHHATLPPLNDAGERRPSEAATTPLKSDDAASLPAAGTASHAVHRESAAAPSPSSSANTPYRAFLREPASPTAMAEVPVEVRREEGQPPSAFRFSYLKTEIQLCRRFTAECRALFRGEAGTAAAGTEPDGAATLTLASDPSAVIDSDGTLREFLALSREAQQPLRVRLHFVAPPKESRRSRPNSTEQSSINIRSSASPGNIHSHNVASDAARERPPHRVAPLNDVVDLKAVQTGISSTNGSPSTRTAHQSKETSNNASSDVSRPPSALPPVRPPSHSVSASEVESGSVVGDGKANRSSHSPLKAAPKSTQAASPASAPSSATKQQQCKAASASAPILFEAASVAAPPITSDSAAASVSGALSDAAEDDGSPARVMSTIPGPSPPSHPPTPATLLHPCFVAVEGLERSAGESKTLYRCQVATRWGFLQRMLCCRVRAECVVEDLVRGVLVCFQDDCEGLKQCDAAPPTVKLSMVIARTDGGTPVSHPLSSKTTIDAFLQDAFVETAELRVTSPQLPSCEPTSAKTPNLNRINDALPPASESEATLFFVASAAVRQLQAVGISPTPTEVHALFCALLGSKSSTEPFDVFLAKLKMSSPTSIPSTQQSVDERSRPDVLAVQQWVDAARTQLSLTSATWLSLMNELAFSLLCNDLRDADSSGCLKPFFTSVASSFLAAGEASPTRRAALTSLWQREGRCRQHERVAEVVHEAEAPPSTSAEWEAAYAAAPSFVLDVLAAARMDGVVRHSPVLLWCAALSKAPQQVWSEAFCKAQLQCCEVMAPGELESYFKGTLDEDDRAEGVELKQQRRQQQQQCRRVLLSCMGALLAPDALTHDYADWLVDHFCGRVGAVLYAKMGSFDGHAALSVPALTLLAWTVLHPLLPSWVAASAHCAVLEKLTGWLRVAVAHACWVRRLSFPPWPLYGLHASQPKELSRYPALSSLAEMEMNAQCSEAEKKQGTGAAAEDEKSSRETETTLLAPVPPREPSSSSPAHPAAAQTPHRKTPNKKVQYVYKYNFNALHRPRSSAS